MCAKCHLTCLALKWLTAMQTRSAHTELKNALQILAEEYPTDVYPCPIWRPQPDTWTVEEIKGRARIILKRLQDKWKLGNEDIIVEAQAAPPPPPAPAGRATSAPSRSSTASANRSDCKAQDHSKLESAASWPSCRFLVFLSSWHHRVAYVRCMPF